MEYIDICFYISLNIFGRFPYHVDYNFVALNGCDQATFFLY